MRDRLSVGQTDVWVSKLAMTQNTLIRDAATVIILRDRDSDTPRILMGQRGPQAAFMPNKFVFPGGAVDPADATAPLVAQINPPCLSRLSHAPATAHALTAAALRELWEETGLYTSDASTLQYVFRAITPPGQPRRFDARFFLMDAAALAADLDDFSDASDELSNLQWIPLTDATQYDLPFITRVVLAEVAARVTCRGAPPTVPFYDNSNTSIFRHIDV